MKARDLAVWDVYFAGIVSIRFHPKNVESLVSVDTEFRQNIIRQCAYVADLMMFEHNARSDDLYRERSGGVDRSPVLPGQD